MLRARKVNPFVEGRGGVASAKAAVTGVAGVWWFK